MGKRIGIWNTSKTECFDYTLVTHDDYEYYQEVFLVDNPDQQSKLFKLKPSVKKNPEIFAWYISTVLTEDEEIDFDSDCYESASGHLISLLQEFLCAFNILDVEICQRIKNACSNIKLQNYYLYRIEQVLDELTTFANILRKASLSSAPFDLRSQADYENWWRQPLIIQQCLSQFESRCNLEMLKSDELLIPLANFYDRFKRGINQWKALRGMESLEGASGYFLALANYWFKAGSYQVSLLFIHRSIDCVLILLAHRARLFKPTVSKLEYDDNPYEFVSYKKTFERLNRGASSILFDSSDTNFILNLNTCRNYLRETHGFRMVKRGEVYDFLVAADRLLKNLTPDVKSYSYKEKFSFDFQIPLKLFFAVETQIDSYIEIKPN